MAEHLMSDSKLKEFIEGISKLNSNWYIYRVKKNTMACVDIQIYVKSYMDLEGKLTIYPHNETFEYRTSSNTYTDKGTSLNNTIFDNADFDYLNKIHELAKMLSSNLHVLYKIRKRND